MEPNSDLYLQLLKEGVSLFVLCVVLVGVYRLTNRAIDVGQEILKECCQHLEEINDTLRARSTSGQD